MWLRRDGHAAAGALPDVWAGHVASSGRLRAGRARMTRVVINGFGRIGRNFLRAYLERRPDFETGHAYTATQPLLDAPHEWSDIVGSPYSCVFDSQLTMAEGALVKVFGWCDNEWGYSCRLVDVVELGGSPR